MTLGIDNLPLFIVSGLLLNMTPGQDTLYIVGRTLSQGRRAGMMSVAGISSGSAIHTLAAAFGLSAILATSASAFMAVKLAGAAYLIYLGLRMVLKRASQEHDDPRVGVAHTDWHIFKAGLLTNVLNPKVALFFMAFLPQFVSADAESKILAFIVLGAIFIFNGTLWCLVLVLAASVVDTFLRRRRATGTVVERVTGLVFVGLGIRLATTK
jgi:RhtB (resistance to homoserine/threonine) family protein